jgi:hypothetical protein
MARSNETGWWRYAASLAVAALIACGNVQGPGEGDPDAALPADAAAVDECVQRDEAYTDYAGRRWDRVAYCRNDAGAPLYADASTSATLVANMDTAYSWFVCYRRGDAHAGGNDVWYYTQGDRAAPGGAGRDEWGYMPAVNVRAGAHPPPQIPAC